MCEIVHGCNLIDMFFNGCTHYFDCAPLKAEKNNFHFHFFFFFSLKRRNSNSGRVVRAEFKRVDAIITVGLLKSYHVNVRAVYLQDDVYIVDKQRK